MAPNQLDNGDNLEVLRKYVRDAIDAENPLPSKSHIDRMLEVVPSEQHSAIARDLAYATIAAVQASDLTPARQELENWLATAEELASTQEAQKLQAAKRRFDSGRRRLSDQLRATLGL